MGIMVYALLWVMQDLSHQPRGFGLSLQGVGGLLPGPIGFRGSG